MNNDNQQTITFDCAVPLSETALIEALMNAATDSGFSLTSDRETKTQQKRLMQFSKTQHHGE